MNVKEIVQLVPALHLLEELLRTSLLPPLHLSFLFPGVLRINQAVSVSVRRTMLMMMMRTRC